MRDAFSFRLSPGTSVDENIERRSILSLILASALQTSVGVLVTNEAKTHRPGFVELTASGLSASMMLSRVETHDKAFDVSPALAVHILLWARRVRRHRGFIADFEADGSTQKSLLGEKRQLLSATVTSLSGLKSHPFAHFQASLREREMNRCDEWPRRLAIGAFRK
jgi:hypothetical protein